MEPAPRRQRSFAVVIFGGALFRQLRRLLQLNAFAFLNWLGNLTNSAIDAAISNLSTLHLLFFMNVFVELHDTLLAGLFLLASALLNSVTMI